jgi:hypothetical protein
MSCRLVVVIIDDELMSLDQLFCRPYVLSACYLWILRRATSVEVAYKNGSTLNQS